jgi:hypothetical protein
MRSLKELCLPSTENLIWKIKLLFPQIKKNYGIKLSILLVKKRLK